VAPLRDAKGRGALLAAVGRTTAEALQDACLGVDVEAAEPSTGGRLAVQLADTLAEDALVLLIQGRHARPELAQGLQAHGLRVVRAVVYENAEPSPPTAEVLAASARADLIYLAAPSAAERLLAWAPHLRDRAFLAIGPTTATDLAERHGITHVSVSTSPDEDAVLAALLTRLPSSGDPMHADDLPTDAPIAQDPAQNRPAQDSHVPDLEPSPIAWSRQKSDALVEAACAVIPGGVNSPVRACKSVHGKPIYIASGHGAEIVDVDGNHYVDFCQSWGPLILGHSDADVVQAVIDAAPRGLSYGACHEAEIRMAEALIGAYPGMEMARLMSSGTEAVMTALRLCRGATGRNLVVKFEGGYHGHSDALLVKAGSGLVTGAQPGAEASSAGIPREIAATTVSVPFADLAAVEKLFAFHGQKIAAVIIEPLPANNGLLIQTPEFLQGLRRLCDKNGALLVFDEVISGFRLHRGGYGQLMGVQPDLVTLGKIIGGGMPIGAVVGPARILSLLAPVGPVYQAGTLSGNPVSIAAGLKTLEKLKNPGVYEHLDRLGAHLQEKLHQTGIPWLRAARVGSIVWPYFVEGPVPVTAAAISPLAIERFNAMYQSVLEAGVYLPPSAYEVLFLSHAHTEADVDRLVDAWAQAARHVA
jgi:glutamate-1-semialdehyde 2,1-aminomutase